MLTVALSLQDPSSPRPSLDTPDLSGPLFVYLYMLSPLPTNPPSLVWNTPTQLSSPTQFSLPCNSTPVPLFAIEFIVCVAWNLLNTATATSAILTLCTSVSPTTWNLTGVHLPGRAPGTSWKLVSVSRSTRRANKGLCPELSRCSLLPLYKVNTFLRLFQSSLGQGCFKQLPWHLKSAPFLLPPPFSVVGGFVNYCRVHVSYAVLWV